MCITKHFKGDRIIIVFDRPYDEAEASVVDTALGLMEKHIRYIASSDDGEDELKVFSRHNVQTTPLQRRAGISLKLLQGSAKLKKKK